MENILKQLSEAAQSGKLSKLNQSDFFEKTHYGLTEKEYEIIRNSKLNGFECHTTVNIKGVEYPVDVVNRKYKVAYFFNNNMRLIDELRECGSDYEIVNFVIGLDELHKIVTIKGIPVSHLVAGLVGTVIAKECIEKNIDLVKLIKYYMHHINHE